MSPFYIDNYINILLSLKDQDEMEEKRTETSIEDFFYKNNLTVEKVRNIRGVRDFKYIFRAHSDWKRREGVETSRMYKKDLELYRSKVLRLMEEEEIKRGLVN